MKVVEALLAKGADVQAKDEVSIARACALCSSCSLTRIQNAHGYLQGTHQSERGVLFDGGGACALGGRGLARGG